MAVDQSRKRNAFIGGLLLLIVGVTCLLNFRSMFYEPLNLWPRIAIPILLAVGFVGSVLRAKSLLLLGWIGSGLFLLIVIGSAIPGEDYRLAGVTAPNMPSGAYVLFRLLFLLAVAVSLMICFRHLWENPGVSEGTPNRDSP
jgi:hypothetical protein